MFTIAVFILSGLGIFALLASKTLEIKSQKRIFVLSLISKGDKHTREIYHRVVGSYAENKEYASHFFKKKVPRHSKNTMNKAFNYFNKKKDIYIDQLRDTKILKKNNGMSDFLKNMSEVDKNNGEINDTYEDDTN